MHSPVLVTLWCNINFVTLPVQAKETADELLKEKIDLEKKKKALVESALEKDAALKTKIKTVGNYVHESVPVSNNEVRYPCQMTFIHV